MPFKHIQLLVVITDDNPHDHYFIRSCMVEYQGVRFVSFFSGQELIDYVSYLQKDNPEETPDLIIIDINMPGLSGPETIQIIQQEYGIELYFAVLSSGSELHSREFSGMKIRHYTKPDSLSEYKRVVLTILDDFLSEKGSKGN